MYTLIRRGLFSVDKQFSLICCIREFSDIILSAGEVVFLCERRGGEDGCRLRKETFRSGRCESV